MLQMNKTKMDLNSSRFMKGSIPYAIVESSRFLPGPFVGSSCFATSLV